VTGEKRKDKEAKVSSARRLWVPAVNNYGRFGRWAFIEINDPWNGCDIDPKFLENRGGSALCRMTPNISATCSCLWPVRTAPVEPGMPIESRFHGISTVPSIRQ
jgi:hypothetical protein